LLEQELPIEVVPDLEGRVVLVVHGALDLPEVGELRALLNEAATSDPPGVVVDLTDVHFVGSSGLGVLLEAHNELAERGTSLVVRGASTTIRRAFAITKLDEVLTLE